MVKYNKPCMVKHLQELLKLKKTHQQQQEAKLLMQIKEYTKNKAALGFISQYQYQCNKCKTEQQTKCNMIRDNLIKAIQRTKY